jgi:hypothetical protein
VIVAARREQAILALEDHGKVGGQGVPGAALMHRVDAEHQSQPPPVRMRRPGKGDAQAAAVRARSPLALQLGVVPVDVEVHGAPDARAQIPIAGRQPLGGAGADRRRRSRGRRPRAPWRR